MTGSLMTDPDHVPSGVNSPHTMDDAWPANTCMVFPEGTEEMIQCLCLSANPKSENTQFHNHTVVSLDPASSTFPFGCHLSHCQGQEPT